MQYNEALDYIHSTLKFGIKLGLENIKKLLDMMGNPHKKLKYVHIAGTNGKGSTAAFMSSVLIESGYSVGTFTSPFLERFTERMKINNLEIKEDEVVRLTKEIKQKISLMKDDNFNHPTEFEIVTAMAFQYFFEQQCDIVVLEVGLGGRFDSTNVIENSLVDIITTINYDHMAILGNTLPKIAYEKAGIIKKGSDVVLYPQEPEVLEVFLDISKQNSAKLIKVNFQSLKIRDFNINGQVIDFEGFKDIKISLIGEHQAKNAVLVLKACEILQEKGFNKITIDSIKKGLSCTTWSGRLEVLKKAPLFLIDGAHNKEGAETFAKAITKYFGNKKKVFIMGVLKDKDVNSLIEETVHLAQSIITITPNSERALPGDILANIIEKYNKNVKYISNIEDAVFEAIKIAKTDDVICAFGSLYYIGEVRKIILNNNY